MESLSERGLHFRTLGLGLKTYLEDIKEKLDTLLKFKTNEKSFMKKYNTKSASRIFWEK